MIVAEIDFSQDIVAIVAMKNIPEYIVNFIYPSPVGHCVLFLYDSWRSFANHPVLYNINIENISLSNS